MKKLAFVLASSILAVGFGGSAMASSPEDTPLKDLYITEAEEIKPDPETGRYSSDFSHIDEEEAEELFKDLREYYLNDNKPLNSRSSGESNTAEELYERTLDLIQKADESINQGVKGEISTFNSQDDYESPSWLNVSNAVTLQMHGILGTLSLRDINSVRQNSNGATAHGARYATERGWLRPHDQKPITVDNPADALRHFAWNFMNSNDLGTSKARGAADVHEAVGIGVALVHNTNHSDARKAELATTRALEAYRLAKRSFSNFNSEFDDAAIMDLHNNSEGRKAFARGHANYSTPFNQGLNNGTIMQFHTWVTLYPNNNYRLNAYNGFR